MMQIKAFQVFLIGFVCIFLFSSLLPQLSFLLPPLCKDTSFVVFAQEQETQPLQEILPGPSFLEKAANFLYIIYDYIRKAVIFILEKTVFKDNPNLASFYGDVASFLASFTAIYLILLLVASAKKIIGGLLLLGWALFFITIILRG